MPQQYTSADDKTKLNSFIEKWGTSFIEAVNYGGIAYRIVWDNCSGFCRLYTPNWYMLFNANTGTKYIGGSGRRVYTDNDDLIADLSNNPAPIFIKTRSIIYLISNYFLGNIPNYSSIRTALLDAITIYFAPLTPPAPTLPVFSQVAPSTEEP